MKCVNRSIYHDRMRVQWCNAFGSSRLLYMSAGWSRSANPRRFASTSFRCYWSSCYSSCWRALCMSLIGKLHKWKSSIFSEVEVAPMNINIAFSKSRCWSRGRAFGNCEEGFSISRLRRYSSWASCWHDRPVSVSWKLYKWKSISVLFMIKHEVKA